MLCTKYNLFKITGHSSSSFRVTDERIACLLSIVTANLLSHIEDQNTRRFNVNMCPVYEQYHRIEAGCIPEVSKIHNILIIEIEVRTL